MKAIRIYGIVFGFFLVGLLMAYMWGWHEGFDEGIQKALAQQKIIVIPIRHERLELGKGKVAFVPNKADWDSLMRRLNK